METSFVNKKNSVSSCKTDQGEEIMRQQEIIDKDTDGFYKPSKEEEVISLVKYAGQNGLQIRVRGASHSVAWSIYTDPVDGRPDNKVSVHNPPQSKDLNLVLSKMNDLVWIDEAKGLAECGSGIHLGIDPYDAQGVATLENSLLYQAWEKGWAVNDTGGITHQAVAGFTQTGSAGGSLKYSFDNIIAYRIIDGTGSPEWIEKGDARFDAVAVSMGLLGIITRVRLQFVPTYNIIGQENAVPVSGPDCPIDIFGPGTSDKPSMAQFLKNNSYARMEWWPQKGAERVIIWNAERQDPSKSPAKLTPYYEFPPGLLGQAEQLLAAVLFTSLGNHGLLRTFAKLVPCYLQFQDNMTAYWAPKISGVLAGFLAMLLMLLIAVIMFLPTLFFGIFPAALDALFPKLLPVFQPMSNGKPTNFVDYYWRSLPMDNSADDVMLGTEFTEIWVPIKYAGQSMNLLRDMFEAGGTKATGYFETEVYGAPPSPFWMSASYSDGNDEYKDGVIRFDIFWYRANDSEPNTKYGFFKQYWDLFLRNYIPFRLHWGKFVPAYDFPFFAEYYKRALPRFDDFMALRKQRDPQNIFFTTYWRERLTGNSKSSA